MKKSLLAILITSALLLSGCQEKELKTKLEYAERDITHLKMDLERSQTEMKKAKEGLENTQNELNTAQENLNEVKAQLQASQEELSKIQGKIPSLEVKPVSVFAQHEKFERDPNTENNNGINESGITYMLTTVETGFPWLDALLYKLTLGEFKIEDNPEKEAQIKAIENSKEQLLALWQHWYETDLQSVKNFEIRDNSYIKSIQYIGQRGKVLTFSESVYTYEGGAHGMHGTRYFNIDSEKQERIELSNLFSEEKLALLKDALWASYETHYGVKDGDNILTFADKERFYTSKEFYFTPNGMHFVYPPYELGPYAAGEIQLNLPWDQLEDLINSEYNWAK